MRPVRSTRSLVPSAQLTLSVHGARAALTLLMRGNVSIARSSVKFIPLSHELVAVFDNPSQGLATMARRNRPDKNGPVADAHLRLKLMADHVHVRGLLSSANSMILYDP